MFDTVRSDVLQLIFIFICVTVVSPVVLSQTGDPTNIIVIMYDDFGVDALNAGPWDNNNSALATPTLARLSEIGVSFTHCRVNPNCSPTRASFFTGRQAIHTGVTGVVWRYANVSMRPCPETLMSRTESMATDLTSLQYYERTLAEVLQDAGYYTVLVDKWHIGANVAMVKAGEVAYDRGLEPGQQGFNEFLDWMDYVCEDDPDLAGDNGDEVDHMERMAAEAVAAVGRRSAEQPYALFYHTLTPHALPMDSNGKKWWEINPLLIPVTETYSDSQHDRFLQNVEGIDTIIRERVLEDLSVISSEDPTFTYREDSNTVVIFLGDNGTDDSLPAFGGKNTPYEGGSNVPLIVFGENISEDGSPLIGFEDESHITHVDFFDTIADIAGIDMASRDNNVGMPREGISFAHKIGWAETGEEREYTLTSLLRSPDGSGEDIRRVSFVSDQEYKVIAQGGGVGPVIQEGFHGLHDVSFDEFYDLLLDPNETNNLLEEGITGPELETYYDMRDLIVDHWPIAVSEAFTPEDLPSYYPEFYDASGQFVLVVSVQDGILQDKINDQFYNLLNDPDRNHDLKTEGMTTFEEGVCDTLWDQVNIAWESNDQFANVCVIDLPLTASLCVDNNESVLAEVFAVGHRNVGEASQMEHRVFLKFGVNQFNNLIPPGFDIDDAIRAQVIIKFDTDSTVFDDSNPDDFWLNDAPTGLMHVYKVESAWGAGLFDDLAETELGLLNLPPHIITSEDGTGFYTDDPDSVRFHETPMQPQTPVSFGHNADLLTLLETWYTTPDENFGVGLVADVIDQNELYQPDGNAATQNDQQVNFLKNAVLRITLKREY